MKIGVSSYSFSKYMKQTGCDLKEVCCLAKGIGFDAIEFITIKAEDPIATAKELRAFCAELGLEIAAYAVGMNLLKGDKEENVAELMRQVDIAEALGAPVMRHDICSALPEGMTWEEAIPKMAPLIRRVTEYAAEKGIRTCSENHGFIFQDSERVEKVINAVDHENYRWLLDIGNFLCADEMPTDAIERALPYTVHVHVKDFLYRKAEALSVLPEGFFKTRNGNLLRGTVLGHGDVPVAACIQRIREYGYDGTVSLEFEGAEENLNALRLGYEYLRKLTK
ncbi:MAG: sugar phosphate isomerase/epimerase [Clostridia bacterium]|nr:sugar phosphate isomerase/epimerase [Clostridia bacterium]